MASAPHRATAWNPTVSAAEERHTWRGFEMAKNVYMVIYFVLMVAAIVAADILFFRNHFLARLIANIAIVAVFAAVYFLFLRNL
jgi:membrane protein YdbS with pleckstrin-like domain